MFFDNKLFFKRTYSKNNTLKLNSNTPMMIQYQFYFKIWNSLKVLFFLEYINEIQKY